MAKFAYNNTKSASIVHTPFKLSYGYHSKVLFKEDINSHLKSCSANKLAEEPRKLIEVYCQNLLHT